jgi:NAD(P)-dependent dehydrogenase (short-subunit alcohol dehydrogenase family)
VRDELTADPESLSQIFDVNTTGVFLTARAAARQMHLQKDVHGSIILIASMSGSIVNKDHHWVAYNASKSAVLQMARNLAAEWGPKDVSLHLSPRYRLAS